MNVKRPNISIRTFLKNEGKLYKKLKKLEVFLEAEIAEVK